MLMTSFLGCEKFTAKWLRFFVSLPMIPPLDPYPPHIYPELKRTSWSFNSNKSGLDGNLDYAYADSSVITLLPMRQLEILGPFGISCCALKAFHLEVTALTTLGDGQGLFGMNVLHLDLCVSELRWRGRNSRSLVNFCVGRTQFLCANLGR